MPAIEEQKMPPTQVKVENVHSGSAIQSPKKQKTEYNKGLKTVWPQYHLKWAQKNRMNYHPLLIRQPYGIKIMNDLILTTEGLWPYSRVQVFDMGGHSLKVIGQGQILPFGITLTEQGDIAVTDHRDRTVQFFSLAGQHLYSWNQNKFDWPNGIATTKEGYLVIADWSKGKVYTMDAQGNLIQSFSTATKRGLLSCPDYLTIDSHGRVIVSDAYDKSLKVFSSTGEILLEMGKQSGPGHVEQPKGVTVDDKNNIIVADWGSDTIKMYDANGSWMVDLVTRKDSLQHPLAVDADVSRRSLVVTEHILKGEPSLKLFASRK